MKWGGIILFVAVCSFSAYYIHETLPEEMEQRWKLMLTNSFFRSLSHLVSLTQPKLEIQMKFNAAYPFI